MKTLLKDSKKWNGRNAFITALNKGAGSAMDPPGYHSHYLGIVAGIDRGNGYQEYASIDYYLESEHVPNYVKLQIKNIIKQYKPVQPIDEKWKIEVLKHFHNCFTINGSVNANDCLIWTPEGGKTYGDKWKTFERDINKNLGVIHIRKFYPEYIPDQNDIKIVFNLY